VGPITILVSEGPFAGIAVENTVPPSFIVSPKAFEGMSQDECRFLIGRYMEHIGSRYFISKKLSSGETWELLCVMARALELDVDIPGKSDDVLQKKLKDARKIISRKNKKFLEDAAKEFLKVYKKFDFQAHLRAQAFTANRAGLLTCNELRSSLSAMAKTDKRFKGLDVKNPQSLREFLSKSEEARDLLQFSLSDDYFILRNRLGLSLLST